jgi:hypothetical protein
MQAASRYECEYLVAIHSSAFLLAGGDPEVIK